jgi:hypothetical protein
MPASSSWDREGELVGLAGELEQPLGGASGDVEEDRVGQLLVGVAQPHGQHLDHVPQQLGLGLVDRPKRLVGDGEHVGRLERPGLGRTGPPVEQRHLAEEVAALHQCHHRLATVDRPVGDGDAARRHDEELRALVALGEEHPTPVERAALGRGNQVVEGLALEVREELDVSEQIWVDHGSAAYLPVRHQVGLPLSGASTTARRIVAVVPVGRVRRWADPSTLWPPVRPP